MKPQDRIIVALDFPSRAKAFDLVDDLDGLISFYKVGLELILASGLEDLLSGLTGRSVFVDLKLPDDIPATIGSVVRYASQKGVKFLTLSGAVGTATIQAALEGRGALHAPELLSVPFLSSQDPTDVQGHGHGGPDGSEFRADLVRRAKRAKAAGVDGFIVSGSEIALLRSEFPSAPLISPGIRPSWSPADDHKRSCTPSEAIRLGADYLVVGRPIRNAGNRAARRAAAQRVIDEVASLST